MDNEKYSKDATSNKEEIRDLFNKALHYTKAGEGKVYKRDKEYKKDLFAAI